MSEHDECAARHHGAPAPLESADTPATKTHEGSHLPWPDVRPLIALYDRILGEHSRKRATPARDGKPPDFDTELEAFYKRVGMGISSTVPVTEITPPLLYGGLTSAECYARWSENRRLVEHGCKPTHAMTHEQIVAAKAVWPGEGGKVRAAGLRARISAGKERTPLTGAKQETADGKDAE